MLKEAAAVTGGALLLPPLGVSIVACGLPGLLVAGAGMFFADAMMKERRSSGTLHATSPDDQDEARQGCNPVSSDRPL